MKSVSKNLLQGRWVLGELQEDHILSHWKIKSGIANLNSDNCNFDLHDIIVEHEYKPTNDNACKKILLNSKIYSKPFQCQALSKLDKNN